MGFISRQVAKKTAGRPVKIRVLRWGYDLGLSIEWHEMPSDKFVQGSLREERVYAGVDSELRVVY